MGSPYRESEKRARCRIAFGPVKGKLSKLEDQLTRKMLSLALLAELHDTFRDGRWEALRDDKERFDRMLYGAVVLKLNAEFATVIFSVEDRDD